MYRQQGRLPVLETTAGYPVLRARPVFPDRGHIAVRVHVAGAGTIPQFAGGVSNIGVFVFLVRPGFVVVCMTAGTVRLKCREPPGHEFSVGLVARGAGEVGSVILRLVWQCRVTVIRRCPRIRVVAGIAFLRGVEVPRILADRCYAIVTG